MNSDTSRLNRMYAILSGVNEVIIRVRDPQEIFQSACAAAVDKAGLKLAWIGIMEQGAVRPVTWAGQEQGYLAERPDGLADQAIKGQRTILIHDIASDASAAAWRDAALSRGYRSAIALPFTDQGALAGALVLYADEPNFFDETAARLLNELVNDIGFALRFLRQEADLRLSEQRFRALFESAGDAIFLLDGDVFVTCNQKTLEMFGCPRNRIVGRHPYDLSPPTQPDGHNSREQAIQNIQAALAGTVQRFEWRHIRGDGTPFDAEVTLNRVEVGGRALLQAIVRDITERKRLEEERQRLTAIIENTPDYIGISTPAGLGIYLNESFKRIIPPEYRTEFQAQQGIPISAFHPPAAWNMLTEVAIPYAIRHGVWQGQTELLDSVGKPFPVSQTIVAHLDQAGNVAYLSTIARDISDIAAARAR